MQKKTAMIYITFDDVKHPKFSFSIMKSVIDSEQKELPVTYNAYDLYRKTGDESLLIEALHFANRFAPERNYTEL